MRLLWSLLLVMGFAVTVSSTTVNAEPVQVRAATNDQGGRLAFIWESPVGYQANLADQTLVLSFGRTIDANFSVITDNLPDFVTATSRSDDGQQVTLSLTTSFELVHFPPGNAIVVDLIGTPGQQETETSQIPEVTPSPELDPEPENVSATEPDVETTAETTTAETTTVPPAESSIDTSALEQVGIRTGVHSDKLRIVFDWVDQVPYRVDRRGAVVDIIFDRAVGMDVSRLISVEPAVVGDARYSVTQQNSIVSLAVAEGAEIKDFYTASKVVVDIVFPTDGSVAGTLPARTGTVTVSASTPTQLPAAPVQEETTPTIQEPESDVAALATAAGNVPEGQPTDLTLTGDEVSSAPPSNETRQEDITSEATGTDNGFIMRFDWTEPVAAAVFRRGSALWVVFDKPAAIDVAAMQNVAGDQLIELTQLPHPSATVLRAVTKRGVNPLPKREGLTWILEFADQSLTTLSPVAAAAQLDSPEGARVFLPVPEPGKAVPLVDPEMGEYFVAVPVIPLGYGVTNLYEYPQFRIRPSSQGVVIEPHVDTLRIRPVRQGIGITSTRTLQISPTSDLDIARAQSDSDRPLSRVIDLEPLQNASLEFFNEHRQELEHTIAMSPSRTKRAEGRFDLVRFFLAHGYSAEALGVLRILADEVPEAKKRADYRLYRGMANFLLHRYDDAREDLKGAELDNNDEGMFWRSLLEFVDGNEAPEVMRGIRSTARIPDPYPRALRIPLALDVIDATIRVGDADRAQEFVESLGAEDLRAKERGELLYLSGMKDQAAGDFEAAIGNFEQAIVGAHRPSRIFSSVARAELLLELERASTIATIDELEKLRFAWRGGKFEFDLLRRLGDLYLSQGGFRQGLSTLRQAATHFREREGAEQITQRMSDTFAYLFLRDGADRLPPVTAIALYEEFKELTPVGDLGDQMIRKLSDRLVKVDLLDEAASLLDGQVKFRLQGLDKVRVGAQLAIVRLLARDYAGALRALEISEGDGVPAELKHFCFNMRHIQLLRRNSNILLVRRNRRFVRWL